MIPQSSSSLTTCLRQIYFVPGFFDSQDWSSWSSVDGILGWNSAWSMDANDINTSLDSSYLARLKDKSYMPAVSVSAKSTLRLIH